MFQLENWATKFSRIEWADIGISLAIFLLFLLLRKVFTKYIYKMIIRLSKKTPTEFFTNVLVAFERPLQMFFVVIGAYLALYYLPFSVSALAFVQKIFQSLVIFFIGWGFYNFASENSSLLLNVAKKFQLDEGSMLLPFLSKVIRVTVIALSFAIILDVWEYNIGGFIAGLGLGGLAFALAAQDTVANFFGGVVIIVEKPFKKGDWILTPTVEGTVEDITFRSTTIRTFADALVTVPNSKLVNEPITNWSMMRKRRVTFHLKVSHYTPLEKIKTVTARIGEMLRGHKDVHPDTIFVYFSEISETSYDIFIYFFTKTTVWAEYLAAKEDINLKLMQILEEEGVELAVSNHIVEINKTSCSTPDEHGH